MRLEEITRDVKTDGKQEASEHWGLQSVGDGEEPDRSVGVSCGHRARRELGPVVLEAKEDT